MVGGSFERAAPSVQVLYELHNLTGNLQLPADEGVNDANYDKLDYQEILLSACQLSLDS